MSRLARERTAEPVSRDKILRRVHFPCSADHEQDWQPYLIDLYSCKSDSSPEWFSRVTCTPASVEVVSSILTKVGFVFILP